MKTLAPTAATASAENARVSRTVIDALGAAGVRSQELASTQLSVGANWSFDESSHRQKRTAYQAINHIRIQTEQLDRVAAARVGIFGADGPDVQEIAGSRRIHGDCRSKDDGIRESDCPMAISGNGQLEIGTR